MFVTRKKENGITLISLVVTVIVLLILAGISISAITGGNGAIDRTIDAKNATEINAEIKTIQMAATNSRTKNNKDNIVDKDKIVLENLEDELKNVIGEGKTYVNDFTANNYTQFAITFIDSGRVYVLNEESDDIEYIGNNKEGSNRGFLVANPKKNNNPKIGERVKVSLTAFSDSTIHSMEYSWSDNKHNVSDSYISIIDRLSADSDNEDSEEEGNENNQRKIISKYVMIDYPITECTYYLHVKAKITKNGKEKDIYNVFGKYVINGTNANTEQYSITYKMGNNVIYIGSTYEIITEGKIYLPSITAKYGFFFKPALVSDDVGLQKRTRL